MDVLVEVASAKTGLEAFDILNYTLETPEERRNRVVEQMNNDFQAYMSAHNLENLIGVSALDIVKFNYPDLPENRQRALSIGYGLGLIKGVYEKQPEFYKITKADFIKSKEINISTRDNQDILKFNTDKNLTIAGAKAYIHKYHVKEAISKGLSIPEIVLKDYPDLVNNHD